jgi:hypothetical protein
MKNETNFHQNKEPDNLMDYFPEPRTIPYGWDLSEMFNSTEIIHETTDETKNTEETGNNSCHH